MDFCFLDSPDKPTREQVGNKGYFLHQMQQMGLPVPPAALLTTDLWKRYQKDPKATTKALKEDIIPQVVRYLKEQNNGIMPLVSIRSAGAVSMPGMMDTVLNVGVTDELLKNLAPGADKKVADKSPFDADVLSRFLSMYGHTVLGMDKKAFDAHQTFSSVKDVEKHFAALYKEHGQKLPPKSLEDQILQCVLAVFDSWNNERAKLYRKLHKLDNDAGTAVVIQRMVFGNKNDASATGVVFSRNPNNGNPTMMGEYLLNAQGEDVVSGSHTPLALELLEEDFPQAFEQLETIARDLERNYKQVQDIEFTIEDEKLYILQARSAKCSPYAKLRMLMDMHRNDRAQAQEVLDSLTLAEYMDLNVRQVDPAFTEAPHGTGLAASMGALAGRVVFGPSTKYEGEPTIFLAKETTPDDLQAISLATGILTASGGATSHAAVVARGMGKVCIVGCSSLSIRMKDGEEEAVIGGKVVRNGDWITMDANRGMVWVGKDVPIVDAKNSQLFWDLEDLVFEANPQWTRVTSKVDDIVQGKPTYYLTYPLDDVEDETLRADLSDATDFLTGVMDLTGKLDFLQQKYANQFLFAHKNAEKVFLRKKELLIEMAQNKPFGHKFEFDLYLGPYEQAHSLGLTYAGYTIRPASDIAFGQPRSDASLVVLQGDEGIVPAEKTAISSRNALLRVLR